MVIEKDWASCTKIGKFLGACVEVPDVHSTLTKFTTKYIVSLLRGRKKW